MCGLFSVCVTCTSGFFSFQWTSIAPASQLRITHFRGNKLGYGSHILFVHKYEMYKLFFAVENDFRERTRDEVLLSPLWRRTTTTLTQAFSNKHHKVVIIIIVIIQLQFQLHESDGNEYTYPTKKKTGRISILSLTKMTTWFAYRPPHFLLPSIKCFSLFCSLFFCYIFYNIDIFLTKICQF